MTRIETFDTRIALAEAAAEVVADALIQGLRNHDRASFACAGGTTPGPVYNLLANRDLPWSRVRVTLTDDRFVDASSPLSNQRLLFESLLSGFGREAKFTPLVTSNESAEAAATAAEADVIRLLPFDVVLLGMGEDGHFASLFPGNAALGQGLIPNGETMVVAAPHGSPVPPQTRVTLTLSALLSSNLIVLLITGEPKRQIIERARTDTSLPVNAVLTQDRTPVRILWAA